MKNLLMNFFSGDDIFESLDLKIYQKSLEKIKNVDKVAFVRDVSEKNLKYLHANYDFIVNTNIDFYYIYFEFYFFIKDNAKDYEYIMYLDTRDVIIQKDPFEYMKSMPNKKMFFTCEGMKVVENGVNLTWNKNLRDTELLPHTFYEELEVVNGGTIGGKREDLLYAYLLALTNANRKAEGVITDQAIYSYMTVLMKGFEQVEFCHPRTDNYCITGEGVKRHGVEMQMIDGLACNMQGEPYHLFHQWDRTEYAEEIRKNFKEEYF
jgi:hypothetical protein